MTYEELLKIEDGIVVLAGEYIMAVQVEAVGVIPEVNFRTYSPERRGLIAYPEGYSHSFMDGSWCSNHPLNLIKNCENLVKTGWSGIILTNSHFVLDAIELYSKKYGKTARFFLTDEKGEVEEHTGKVAPIYKSFCRAIDILDEVRDGLEQ